ncbi:MAG: sodium:calcium antiporter [Haloarculaceae archaeon]
MDVTGTLLTQIAVGAVALYTLVTASQRAIDSLLALAASYDVPDVLVGLTVLALGTSLPELGSHVIASLGILGGVLDYRIASAVVIGGNMGSSTTQQLLLVGVFLVGYGHYYLTDAFLRNSYLPMVLALALTLATAIDGTVSRLDGLVLLVAYVVYVGYNVAHRERSQRNPEAASRSIRRDATVSVAMLFLVLASASLLLAVVQDVVTELALGGSMIGVVTIGVASALPELTTVLESIRRRTPNVALGTLVGSNVVNPLVGIGLGGALSTYYVPPAVIWWDLPFKIVVAVALLAYATVATDRTLTRREGVSMIVLYFAFVTTRLLLFPGQ